MPNSHQARRHRQAQLDPHVSTAGKRRRLRLLEDDAGDAKQDGHHGDTDAETGREHGGANGMRRQRSQRQPSDHRVTSRSILPSLIVSTRAARLASA